MKHKFFIAAMILTLSLSANLIVSAYQNGVNLVLNGKETNAKALEIDGEYYLPLQAVAEAFRTDVNWDEEKKSLVVSSPNNEELVTEIIKQVSPSVVGVIGNWKDRTNSMSDKYSEDIIHGTGVIIGSTGEILTNAHVVKHMERIIIVLYDGSGFEGSLKYIDDESDLAVVQIESSGLQPAKFGKDEDIITGKTAIAIGTPVSFSLRNSASIGIVSGVNRSINSSYRLIQTDAAINPGNSGGPLVNLKGEVIGINSSKFAGNGVEGLGFSIPVNTVRYVLKQFENNGKVIKPYLGVEFEEDWAARVGLPTNYGLLIKNVLENTPAEEAGLKIEDSVLAINDQKISTIVDFNEEMKKYSPYERLTLKIRRQGVIQSIEVVLGKK